eukprot:15469533-Alexandrium_andersonii.AAC.1
MVWGALLAHAILDGVVELRPLHAADAEARELLLHDGGPLLAPRRLADLGPLARAVTGICGALRRHLCHARIKSLRKCGDGSAMIVVMRGAMMVMMVVMAKDDGDDGYVGDDDECDDGDDVCAGDGSV